MCGASRQGESLGPSKRRREDSWLHFARFLGWERKVGMDGIPEQPGAHMTLGVTRLSREHGKLLGLWVLGPSPCSLLKSSQSSAQKNLACAWSCIEERAKRACRALASANSEVVTAGEFGNCASLALSEMTSATDRAVCPAKPFLAPRKAAVVCNVQCGLRHLCTGNLHDYRCMYGMYKHRHSEHSAYCFVVYPGI